MTSAKCFRSGTFTGILAVFYKPFCWLLPKMCLPPNDTPEERHWLKDSSNYYGWHSDLSCLLLNRRWQLSVIAA
jgi:hypothetical protein